MSNVVGRGLGQPGEGALVAQGLGVGQGVDPSLEALCQANGQVTCEIDPGSVAPPLPGGGGETARRLRVIDLEPALLRAEADMAVDLEAVADLDGLLVAAPAMAAEVDVVMDLDAIVAASSNVDASPQRVQDEATALALLL